jgi:outer membrane exchange protein TraA
MERSVATARQDIGDGLCATTVHVKAPSNGAAPFSSVNDALAVLDRTSTTLTEDRRVHDVYSLVNFRNNYPLDHCDFSNPLLFPFSDNAGAAPAGDDDNFAMRLRGYLNVNEAESAALQRTLGIYADDGARILIGGYDITVPDVNEQLSGQRLRQLRFGGGGLYPIEIIYYQNGSAAILELAESNLLIPENTPSPDLHALDFRLIGDPGGNLFANTELYTSKAGPGSTCVECREDRICGSGNYCAKDFGPAPSDGLCQPCSTAEHCGRSCQACSGDTPLCGSSGCVQCLTDDDCDSGDGCDPDLHTCANSSLDSQSPDTVTYVGGCSTTPILVHATSAALIISSGSALLLFLALLELKLLRRDRRRRPPRRGFRKTLWILGLISLHPSAASAQLSANAQTLQPAIGPENILTVEGSRTGNPLRPMFNILVDYSYRPLRLVDLNSGYTLANTVPSMTTLHLMAGMSLTSFWSIAADLPLVVNQGFDPATPVADVRIPPASYGLSDLRLVTKFRIINNERGGFGLAFVPQASFPTGDSGQFRGDNAYGIEPRFALDYRTRGGAILALNLGFLGRTATQIVGMQEIGSQVRYGLGAYLPVSPSFGVLGELAGGTSISTAPVSVPGIVSNPSLGVENPGVSGLLSLNPQVYSPLEGYLGVRYASTSGLNVNLGGGTGFTDAVGSPQVRLLASVGYLPISHRKPRPLRPLTPGIPAQAPPSVAPPAPLPPGLPQPVAAAPAKTGRDAPVMVKIQKIGDGTGEVTSAPDGISCGKVCASKFALEQELALTAVPDKGSRFAGWEGPCTGVNSCVMVMRADAVLTARFIKSQIEVTPAKLDLRGKAIHFESGRAFIAMDSCGLLDEVVVILKQTPDMHLRIEGHTDSVPFHAAGGNLQLSKERAAAVVKYLVEHGILADRLSSEGFGDTCPAATNQTPKGRQTNRRTEFLIVDPLSGKYEHTACVNWTPPPAIPQLRKQVRALSSDDLCCHDSTASTQHKAMIP